jgi:hypothetical protein
MCVISIYSGAPDTAVMAMTVNPDVVLSAPDTLHVEGLYAFRLVLLLAAIRKRIFLTTAGIYSMGWSWGWRCGAV